MRMKAPYAKDMKRTEINRFPNFHRTRSAAEMKELYYGKSALLVRYGNYIYNVSSEPEIYYDVAH